MAEGDFSDDDEIEWGAGGVPIDPEDDEEESAAAERRAKNREETPEQRRDRLIKGAQGVSEIPDGETGDELMKRLARTHAHLAISTLADVAENATKDAARNTAANSLLARGFGSVMRRSEQKVDVTVQDHRKAHLESLKLLAAENPVLDITDAEFEEIERAPKAKRRDDDDD